MASLLKNKSAVLLASGLATGAQAGVDIETSPGDMADKPETAFAVMNRLEPAAFIGANYFSPEKVKDAKNVEVTQIETFLNIPLYGGGSEDGWLYFVGLDFNQREFEVKG